MNWHGTTYDEIYRNFKWDIPEYFNIGVDICDKWAVDKKSFGTDIPGSR